VASLTGWLCMKLTLKSVDRGPFSCMAGREVDLAESLILCNSVTFPWETNRHGTRLFVIGNEFGAIGAVWADCEQDAFDELVDADMGESLLVDDDDKAKATDEEWAEWACLGNAGEPADLTNVWIQIVRLDPALDCQLLCKFAEARGAQQTTLDN
jgi:hypothetical protein